MLSVLGKASSSNNVERLDLKIIDNDQARRAKRGRPGQHVNGPRDTDEYEGSDQEREGGIEATLIMKLVCRHGEHTLPGPA